MKITFIVSSDRFGGAETQALLLAKKLKVRHELSIICNGGYLAEQFRTLGLPVKTIPLRDNADIFGLSRLFFHLRSNRPDLLHLHMNRACLLGALAGKALDIPTIGHMQSFTRKLYARFPDHLFVCAPGMIDYYAEFGRNRDKINVVFNAMDPESFSSAEKVPADLRSELGIPEQSVIALFVGRLHPMKGVREIIEYALRSRALESELHFVLVGDGSEMKWMQEKKQENELKNLHFLGFRQDVKRCITGSDFLILPSYAEGIPVSLTEGLFLSKPFVAYDVNDVHVLSETGGGLLVTKGDMETFFNSCLKLANDIDFCRESGTKGRKIIEKYFLLENCLKTIDTVYKGFLRARSGN